MNRGWLGVLAIVCVGCGGDDSAESTSAGGGLGAVCHNEQLDAGGSQLIGCDALAEHPIEAACDQTLDSIGKPQSEWKYECTFACTDQDANDVWFDIPDAKETCASLGGECVPGASPSVELLTCRLPD